MKIQQLFIDTAPYPAFLMAQKITVLQVTTSLTMLVSVLVWSHQNYLKLATICSLKSTGSSVQIR